MDKVIVHTPKLGNNGDREREGIRRDSTLRVAAPA
jgi:hypothetical protein